MRTRIFSRGFTYYQVNTLDSRIANIDQLLAQDVEKFCTSVADLYSNICKVRIFLPLDVTKSFSSAADPRHYYLRSKIIRSDRRQRSVVARLLSRLLGIRLDAVRSIDFEERETCRIVEISDCVGRSDG